MHKLLPLFFYQNYISPQINFIRFSVYLVCWSNTDTVIKKSLFPGQVCYYAANGFWPNNKQPDKNIQDRFFYNGDNLIDWQEIWNKCAHYFKRKPFVIESVHYPPPETPSSETFPPDTPSPNTPTQDYFTYFTLPLSSLQTSETHLPSTLLPPKTPSTKISLYRDYSIETLPPRTTLPKTSHSTPEPSPPETPPPIKIPNENFFIDEPPTSEPPLEDTLPPWYYPEEPVLSPPRRSLIRELKPTKIKTTSPTTTANLPTTSTISTTLTCTTKPGTFTSNTDTTIPTLITTITKPNTTIITTPTTIKSKTDLTTVEGPICPTCSHNKDACQSKEKHLHLHFHIDSKDSILNEEVLKTLKLFNSDKK